MVAHQYVEFTGFSRWRGQVAAENYAKVGHGRTRFEH
jgi:hypothetical protein